jgi:hypothetical protein
MLGLLLFGLVPFPPGGHAQDSAVPLVVFIEDTQLVTSFIQDGGPDGASELSLIFASQGARVDWIYVTDPIPPEARVVVIARPLRPLPVDFVARLWAHLLRGNHLLLAVDPPGQTVYRGEGSTGSNPDRANAGLPILLNLVFGIGLQDVILTEPWFSKAILQQNRTSHMVASVEDVVVHPVIAPLAAAGVPIQMWGARAMRVEPFGPHSYAMPLLYTETPYGEANLNVFREDALLEINLGQDSVGRLLVGALGENTLTGSRIAILGDSEIVQNGYGLAIWQGTNEPIHVGNRVLTERLVAWLLGRPEEEWPSLPVNYTYLRLDGSNADWPSGTEILPDDSDDALVPRYDMERVHAFRDDRYLYMLVELSYTPNPDVRLTLGFENTFDGVIDVTLAITREGAQIITTEGNESVLDTTLAVGEFIEVRVPLRLVGEGALIGKVCLSDSRTPPDSPPIDCATQIPVVVPVTGTLSPVDTWVNGPRVIVDTLQAGINVRADPGENAQVIETAYNGQVFVPLGRTALGDWIQVQNAAYTGWVASFLLRPNIDIGELPIVTP